MVTIGAVGLLSEAHPANARGAAAIAASEERKAAEKLAAMPINKLKKAREQLSSAALKLEEQNWTDLRDVLALQPLASVRFISKEMMLSTAGDVSDIRADYLSSIGALDKMAYEQQYKSMRSLGTACVNARVPRDGLPSCFIDITPQTALLKKAEVALAALIAQAL